MKPILLCAGIGAEVFLILFFTFGPIVIYLWLGAGLIIIFTLWLIGATIHTHTQNTRRK